MNILNFNCNIFAGIHLTEINIQTDFVLISFLSVFYRERVFSLFRFRHDYHGVSLTVFNKLIYTNKGGY